jgi:cell shape-determining protein MreC
MGQGSLTGLSQPLTPDLSFFMTLRLRIFLILIGIVFIVLSLLALAYAFAPVETQQVQATLAPTLFSPP